MNLYITVYISKKWMHMVVLDGYFFILTEKLTKEKFQLSGPDFSGSDVCKQYKGSQVYTKWETSLLQSSVAIRLKFQKPKLRFYHKFVWLTT